MQNDYYIFHVFVIVLHDLLSDELICWKSTINEIDMQSNLSAASQECQKTKMLTATESTDDHSYTKIFFCKNYNLWFAKQLWSV